MGQIWLDEFLKHSTGPVRALYLGRGLNGVTLKAGLGQRVTKKVQAKVTVSRGETLSQRQELVAYCTTKLRYPAVKLWKKHS